MHDSFVELAAKLSIRFVLRKRFGEIDVILIIFKNCVDMKEPFVFSEFRKSLGLTQEEFAEKCGATVRSVQNWEQGGTITLPTMKLFRYIEAEILSGKGAVALDHSTAVAGSGNSLNPDLAGITEKFISLLEEKDRQISRLLALLENSQN